MTVPTGTLEELQSAQRVMSDFYAWFLSNTVASMDSATKAQAVKEKLTEINQEISKSSQSNKNAYLESADLGLAVLGILQSSGEMYANMLRSSAGTTTLASAGVTSASGWQVAGKLLAAPTGGVSAYKVADTWYSDGFTKTNVGDWAGVAGAGAERRIVNS